MMIEIDSILLLCIPQACLTEFSKSTSWPDSFPTTSSRPTATLQCRSLAPVDPSRNPLLVHYGNFQIRCPPLSVFPSSWGRAQPKPSPRFAAGHQSTITLGAHCTAESCTTSWFVKASVQPTASGHFDNLVKVTRFGKRKNEVIKVASMGTNSRNAR